MTTRYASRCLESWSPVSDRIITARFHSKHIKTTIAQVYAPTNEAADEAKETYAKLQKVLDAVPRHDMLLVMGDWNAKVGARQEGENGIVGKHGLICERNDNGDRFVSYCACNNLAITSTMFAIRMCTSIHGPPQMVSTGIRSTTWQSGPSLRGQCKTRGCTDELM